MRAYAKEIPGKVHNKSEDSHYEEVRQLLGGVEVGLFLVADGLSEHAGINASHITVRSLRDDLGKKLFSSDTTGFLEAHVISAMRNAALATNEELVSTGGLYTTLDALAVVGTEVSSDAYIAHLGDSRIYAVFDKEVKVITPDESSDGVPTNYLGCYKVNSIGDPIEKRIRQSHIPLNGQKSSGDGSFPSFFLLATDGLHSRLSDSEIADVLLTLHQRYISPKSVLDDLARRVYRPRHKLMESFDKSDELARKLRTILPAMEMAASEKLVAEVLKQYEQGSNDIVRIVDTALRFDDTTLVLVDLKDSIEYQMGELRSLHTDVVPSLQQKLGDAERAVQLREEELQRLHGDYAALEGHYEGVCADLTSSRTEKEKLQQDLFTQRRDLEERIRTLKEQNSDLSKKSKEESGHLCHLYQRIKKIRFFPFSKKNTDLRSEGEKWE